MGRTAASSLGELGGASSSKQLLEALNSVKEPWVRGSIVLALENFKDDTAVVARLQVVAREDSSYRARGAALRAIGHIKGSGAYETLVAAVSADSPSISKEWRKSCCSAERERFNASVMLRPITN